MIINHNHARLEQLVNIPDKWIDSAKEELQIVYWHTSHGSQLTDGGMDEMRYFIGGGVDGKYSYGNVEGDDSVLDLHELTDDLSEDVGDWVNVTRNYLGNPNNLGVNVVMWSWCNMDGHPVSPDDHPTNNYLTWMDTLISEYGEGGSESRAAEHPVKFVFMTAHAIGTGHDGYVGVRNGLIRQHCKDNNRYLYDFADIESYRPSDLTDYWALDMYDDCSYDDGEGTSGNWAVEWQSEHLTTHMVNTGDDEYNYTNGGEWYECDPAHASSADIMGNLKAYGAWYLFAVLAGWDGN